MPPVKLHKVLPALSLWQPAPGAAAPALDPMVEAWQPVWAPAPGQSEQYQQPQGPQYAAPSAHNTGAVAIPRSELVPFAGPVIAVAARPGSGGDASRPFYIADNSSYNNYNNYSDNNHAHTAPYAPTAAPPAVATGSHAPPQNQYNQQAFLSAAVASAARSKQQQQQSDEAVAWAAHVAGRPPAVAQVKAS